MSQYQSRRARQFDSRANNTWRRNQNTVAFAPTAALGPIAHTVLITLMIAVLGLIYLTQVTRTSSFAYELNESEQTQEELLAQYQDLQVENARLQALERVKDSDVARNMTTPESVDYANN